MEDVLQKNWTLGSKDTNYKTSYDSSLLVRIDRFSRRKDYLPMFGYDVWQSFEMNFLLPSGLPWFGVIKIFVDCNSPYIFESKSFKLYLFSFNNTVFESVESVMKIIEEDLNKVTGLDTMGQKVFVKIVSKMQAPDYFYRPEVVLENLYPACECKDFLYNPSLLKTIELQEDKTLFYSSDCLRSNCEITKQPDFSQLSLVLQTQNRIGIDEESLLKYLVSFRNHNEFHEPCCERIYNDLFKLLNPEALTVISAYTRRGGISITPIRSNIFRKPTSYQLPKNLQH